MGEAGAGLPGACDMLACRRRREEIGGKGRSTIVDHDGDFGVAFVRVIPGCCT